MEIILNHDNLNLFRFFGGDCANENNTTRAFLIALTKSPWSPVLLRGFFDLLAEKLAIQNQLLASKCAEFLSGWPKRVEFSMQQGVAKGEFLSDEVRCGLLVLLTPGENAAAAPGDAASREAIARGIIDALLVVESAADKVLALLIESKLYGPVGDEQAAQYLAAMKRKLGDSVAMIDISWDEIYCLTEALPPQAEVDSVLSDFKAFIDARPHLVSFNGFHLNDFADWYLVDTRLRRLCERVASEALVDDKSTIRYRFNGSPQRKRQGADYDLPLENQQNLRGNIGLACWDLKVISAKLAVGWRTNWETWHVLEKTWNSPDVRDCLRRLCDSGRLVLDVHVRLYFSRFEEHSFIVWTAGPEACEVWRKWDDAVNLIRRFHRQEATDMLLDELLSLSGETEADAVDRARKQSPRTKCFVGLVFCVQTPGPELAKKDAGTQLAMIQKDLLALADLLASLSK